MLYKYVCYFLHLVQRKHYLEKAASYLNMDFHGIYFGIIAN